MPPGPAALTPIADTRPAINQARSGQHHARCRHCHFREYEHEDDGTCDLADCPGFEKE